MSIKIGTRFIRMAYKIFDVEASGDASMPDDRMMEYSFALSRFFRRALYSKNRKDLLVLDVGSVSRINVIPPTLCEMGISVIGLDTRIFRYSHPNFTFVMEDIRNNSFSDNMFDCVFTISTIEHVGVAGRYGFTESDMDGDVSAMQEIWRVTKESGIAIVTLPYNETGKWSKLNRVYNRDRIERLIDGWEVVSKIFFYNDAEKGFVPFPRPNNNNVSYILAMELRKVAITH